MTDITKQDEFTIKAEGAMAQALYDLLAERLRQVDDEGWSPEHDDQHAFGELAKAAGCYAWIAGTSDNLRLIFDAPPPTWPSNWGSDWWKPTDRRRDLVKAGALILAEIERLDRIQREAMVNGNSRRIQ